MKSTISHKDELIKEILRIWKTNPKQFRKVIKEGLGRYTQAVTTFGIKSPLAKESLAIAKEAHSINKTEEKLFKFILDNIDSFDVSSVENVISTIDELNDETYSRLIRTLVDIEIACNLEKEDRALDPNRLTDKVITNNKYKAMVLGLTQKMSDVKNFLNYEEEFWLFIEDHLKVEPSPAYIAEKTCGIKPIVDENGNLVQFYTIIPRVVDMDTAMIAIEILKKAHNLYTCVGKKYSDIVKISGESAAQEYKEQLEEAAGRKFK